MKYNYLDADEAEAKFESRDKTLNYFSIMMSKRLKGQQEEGEGLGEEGAGLDDLTNPKKSKKQRRKVVEEEDGLVGLGDLVLMILYHKVQFSPTPTLTHRC